MTDRHAPAQIEATTVDLPTAFYDDHAARDLPSGTVVKRLARTIRVRLDQTAYDDLLSDALHYADPVNGYASEYPGLVASARATARRLMEVLRPTVAPEPEPAWADDVRDIAAAKHDITFYSRLMRRHAEAGLRRDRFEEASRGRSHAWTRYGQAVDRAMAKGATPQDLPLVTLNDGVGA